VELLGIGLPELAFIVIIALIVLGPKDMVAAGRTLGKTLRRIVTSPTWKAVRTAGQELQQMPTRLMREAGIEEELEELDRDVNEVARSIDPRNIEKEIMSEPAPPPPPSPFAGHPPSELDPDADFPAEKPQA
jgi:Sec-independent protein translocase protein TatA